MADELSILNVGAGDTKLTFDKSNPEERKRAATIVTDMITRGFAIMVQVGEKDGQPLYQRAHDFDPETCEYIIFGTVDSALLGAAPKKQKLKAVRVPAEGTKAVSVARSAGG